MKIICFISGAEAKDLKQTFEELRQCTLTKQIFVVSHDKPEIEGVGWIESESFVKTDTLKAISKNSTEEFTLFYTKHLPLKLGQSGLERMARMAAGSSCSDFSSK